MFLDQWLHVDKKGFSPNTTSVSTVLQWFGDLSASNVWKVNAHICCLFYLINFLQPWLFITQFSMHDFSIFHYLITVDMKWCFFSVQHVLHFYQASCECICCTLSQFGFLCKHAFSYNVFLFRVGGCLHFIVVSNLFSFCVCLQCCHAFCCWFSECVLLF